jgi:hypothetical protein
MQWIVLIVALFFVLKQIGEGQGWFEILDGQVRAENEWNNYKFDHWLGGLGITLLVGCAWMLIAGAVTALAELPKHQKLFVPDAPKQSASTHTVKTHATKGVQVHGAKIQVAQVHGAKVQVAKARASKTKIASSHIASSHAAPKVSAQP